MIIPKISNDKLIAVSKYIQEQKVGRDLQAEGKPLVIETGCFPLDWSSGIGGMPRGRIIEIFGGESTGKSTLAMTIARNELRQNPEALVLYCDFERGTAKTYAQAMGLLEYGARFQLLDMDSVEQCSDFMKAMFDNGLIPSIIICDSVAAMTPMDQFDRSAEENSVVGQQARKLSDLLAKWSKYAADLGILVILLNQTRTFIVTDRFAPKRRDLPGTKGTANEETPGGKAVKFYTSMRIRLEIRQVTLASAFNPMTGEAEEMPIANVVKAVFVKNKLAPPYRAGQFYIEFGRGVDPVRTMLSVATNQGLVGKSGRSNLSIKFTDTDELIAKDEESLVELIRGNKATQDKLTKLLAWDKADEIISKTIKRVTVRADGEKDTGESLTPDIPDVTQAMIDQQPSVIHKAEVLNLLDKGTKAGVYGWTSPGKQQKRSKTLDGLLKSLDPEERKALEEAVASTVEVLKERWAAATSGLPVGTVTVLPPEGEEEE